MSNQLYIKVNGKTLDLNPGTVLEIEEENPFLQLNDELKGDYSLPFEVPMTERNMPIFDHVQLLPAKDKLNQVDNVQAGDDLEQMIGILKKEQLQSNLNHVGTDKLSVYLLKGWSHFYKDIENKTLQDADYGGNRDFGAAQPPHKYSDALITHFQTVMKTGTPDLFDYAIYPFYNNGRIGDGTDPVFEEIIKTYNLTEIDFTNSPRIYNTSFVSFQPYLNYVIRRSFESFGWKVSGFIFNSPDFKKITLMNTQYVKPYNINGRAYLNLLDHMPPVKVSSFLIALKNRLGWWYDFDYLRKTCVIRQLNDVFSGQKRIDITSLCNTDYTLKIPAEKKVYGLSPTGTDGINLSTINFKSIIPHWYDLPAPTVTWSGQVFFATDANKYYICQLKQNSDSIYEWAILNENDFGYLPTGKTDDINTMCQVPISRIVDYKRNSNDESYGRIVIPEVNLQNDNEDTDLFYICYHHGLQPDIPYPGKPTVQLPTASAVNYSIDGRKLCEFSLTYHYFPFVYSTMLVPAWINYPSLDNGLYVKFWKSFLDRLNQKETMEITVKFPQHIAMQLKWQDTLLIRNTEFIIAKKSRVVAYNGELKLTLARI